MDKMKTNYHHTTDVKELAINGTTVAAGAAELDQFMLTGTIADVSSAASSWVACPVAATIEKIYTVIDGTIATANAAVTFEIGGVAVTGGAVEIAYSGSAAGDVDTATPTAANTLTAGQPIEIVNAGASTNAVIGVVTFVMQRT